MDLWKQTACRLAHVAGLTRALDRDSGVRILTYHSVIPGCATGFLESQRVDLFRAQMQYLCARFDVVPLEQALAMRPAARPQGRPVVAVTFDDGFADNYSYAFPVVRELAVPVTIFLATDFLDGERAPWPTRLREVIMTTRKLMHPAYPDLDLSSQEGRRSAAAKLKGALAKLGPLERLETVERLARDWDAGPSRCHPLTWDQVRKMADAEICFGSHTVFHSILTDASETVIAMELSRSKQRIESELGRQCS